MLNFDTEEVVEDTLAVYLNAAIGSNMKCYVASDEAIQKPCVVIFAYENQQVTDESLWEDVGVMTIALAIITEAAPLVGQNGAPTVTARERNSQARRMVLNAVCKRDLANLLAAIPTPLVWSSIQVIGKRTRTIDAERREFITTIMLEACVAPGSLTEV
jgi:hypothetical protein